MSSADREALAQIEKTRVALATVRDTLDAALTQFKAWQADSDTPPSALEWHQHRESLVMAYARFRALQSDYEALLRLNQRLLKQHTSAKNAFAEGWEAAMTHLESRAVGETFVQLRQLLDALNADDWPF